MLRSKGQLAHLGNSQTVREATALAKLRHCDLDNKAKMHRLMSENEDYRYQRLYIVEKCKGSCNLEYMQWRGEYYDGELSDLFDISRDDYSSWKRRSETPIQPEAQLMSEYSERMGRPADVAAYYHNTLKFAERWWKGRRV